MAEINRQEFEVYRHLVAKMVDGYRDGNPIGGNLSPCLIDFGMILEGKEIMKMTAFTHGYINGAAMMLYLVEKGLLNLRVTSIEDPNKDR